MFYFHLATLIEAMNTDKMLNSLTCELAYKIFDNIPARLIWEIAPDVPLEDIPF